MSDHNPENLALFSRPQSSYSAGGDSYHQPQHPDDQQGQYDQHYQDDQKHYQGDNPTELYHYDEGVPSAGGDLGGGEPPLDDVLGALHQKALDATGFGKLQWVLFLVLGMGIMGDGIELLVTAFILPGAERELCMDERMKGWLGAIAFAGMMVGALIWGNLADKVGRRVTLMTALFINLVFSIVAAFVPSYWLFLTCRLLSGVGIGGSIPIVFAYFGEFCPLDGRGKKLGFLLMFWVLGGIYVSGLAWLIIPQTDIQLSFTSGYVFGSWRVFMLICTVPIIFALLGLLVMPESPRYLLQVGKDLDALEVYRKVYMWNHTEKGATYEMPEIELPNRPSGYQQDQEPATIVNALENFWNSIFQLFLPPLQVVTLVLSITWFSTAFGYYGLTIWFPEYVKKLEQEAYQSHRVIADNIHHQDMLFTNMESNRLFSNSTFTNVTFRNIYLDHVSFDHCVLRNVTFQNVTAQRSHFIDSLLVNSKFNDTNFYKDRFPGTEFINTQFGEEKGGCRVDFDTSYNSRQVFLENFLGQLAVIPGTLITAFAIDQIGRVRMLAGSLFLSGVSVFFIWFTDTEVAVVAMNCVFNFVVVGAWNCIDIVSTELYPTRLRSSGFGFLSFIGRIAAILGNVAFGQLISVSKAIPILITAAIMALGGVLSFKLPESKNKLL